MNYIEFNQTRIKMRNGNEFRRIDIGKAIDYCNPYLFGYNSYGSAEWLTWEQLEGLLCRCTYLEAKKLSNQIREVLSNTVPSKPSIAFVKQEYQHAKELAMTCGKDEKAAIEAANNAIRNTMGVDVLNELFKADAALTTEQIAKEIKLPKEKVDKWLVVLNYQSAVNGEYIPTVKGKPFAAVQGPEQILWHPAVMSELRELMPQ